MCLLPVSGEEPWSHGVKLVIAGLDTSGLRAGGTVWRQDRTALGSWQWSRGCREGSVGGWGQRDCEGCTWRRGHVLVHALEVSLCLLSGQEPWSQGV